MQNDARSRPQPCYCCRQPLTLMQRIEVRRTPAQPEGKEVTVETWECTNQECISYRARHGKIPTPPQTK